MTFPDQPFDSIANFFDAYADQMRQALASVSRASLDAAQAILTEAVGRDAQIFSCGNGGSAAIANHLVCDHAKGIGSDTGLRPRVQSLSCNVEVMTAVANDISYADVFSWQVGQFARAGDVLISISSSGDSENVVRAVQTARDVGMKTIALTGFAGGRSATLADVSIHVTADNYGVVEDVHQSIMHVLAQFVRLRHMPAHLVTSRKF